MVFGKPINRYYTPPKTIFFVFISGFYACMSRAGTPVVECLSAHAASEAHRISASFEQPGPVIGAAGQRTRLFGYKCSATLSGQQMTDKNPVFACQEVIYLDILCVLEPRSHGGNMAGTNAKLGGAAVCLGPPIVANRAAYWNKYAMLGRGEGGSKHSFGWRHKSQDIFGGIWPLSARL